MGEIPAEGPSMRRNLAELGLPAARGDAGLLSSARSGNVGLGDSRRSMVVADTTRRARGQEERVPSQGEAMHNSQ